jgi:hypothetical protein
VGLEDIIPYVFVTLVFSPNKKLSLLLWPREKPQDTSNEPQKPPRVVREEKPSRWGSWASPPSSVCIVSLLLALYTGTE